MQATDFTLANETRSYIFDRLVTCVHRVEGYQAALYDHTEGLESAKFRRAVGRLARKINEVAAELNFGNKGAAEKAWEEVEDIYESMETIPSNLLVQVGEARRLWTVAATEAPKGA